MKSNANPGGVYLDPVVSSRGGSSSLDAAGFRRRSTRQVFVGALDACDFAGRGALVTSSHTRVCITIRAYCITDSRLFRRVLEAAGVAAGALALLERVAHA